VLIYSFRSGDLLLRTLFWYLDHVLCYYLHLCTCISLANGYALWVELAPLLSRLGAKKHSAYQSACDSIWNANPNSDTQAAAVSSFHNHIPATILYRNHKNQKEPNCTIMAQNVSFKYVMMGCANNNRIKWQITVAGVWLSSFSKYCILRHNTILESQKIYLKPQAQQGKWSLQTSRIWYRLWQIAAGS